VSEQCIEVCSASVRHVASVERGSLPFSKNGTTLERYPTLSAFQSPIFSRCCLAAATS